MIITYLRQLIGTVPSAGSNYDYSILEYVIAGTIVIFLISLGYRLILHIFKV